MPYGLAWCAIVLNRVAKDNHVAVSVYAETIIVVRFAFLGLDSVA